MTTSVQMEEVVVELLKEETEFDSFIRIASIWADM